GVEDQLRERRDPQERGEREQDDEEHHQAGASPGRRVDHALGAHLRLATLAHASTPAVADSRVGADATAVLSSRTAAGPVGGTTGTIGAAHAPPSHHGAHARRTRRAGRAGRVRMGALDGGYGLAGRGGERGAARERPAATPSRGLAVLVAQELL